MNITLAHCNWHEDTSQPCWGTVTEISHDGEDGAIIMACQGHQETWDWCNGSIKDRAYIPPSTLNDTP